MSARRLYAVHLPARSLLKGRLFRFQAGSLRALRMGEAPSRWRVVPEPLARRVAARAEARRLWRYESPGTWSAPLHPILSAWWRLRLRGGR